MIKKITLAFLLCFTASQLTMAQTYFSDDFSSGTLANWTLTDSDGDTNNWLLFDFADNVQDETAMSASYINDVGALTPDNWMVSPAIDLTSASGNVFLQWQAYATDQNWANENYTVYVATASDIATLGASATSFNEIVGTSATGFQDKNIDVTSFIGQTIYVAFRHHNVSDQYQLAIDNVIVRSVNDDDAELASIDIPRYGLVNTTYPFEITVNNTGGNAITSLDVSWTDGTTTNSATISTNIAGGATATVTHPDAINYATTVEKTISATITNVNGGADSNTTNNDQSVLFNTMIQAGTKVVFIEEATGTWCGWCPRGAIGLDYMTTTYPETVVGVAVHNGDPMVLTEYDTEIGNYIEGYPSSLIDRQYTGVDPGQSSLQGAYDILNTEVVPVGLTAGATQNGSVLSITANANFYTSFSNANFRLGVIITEDGVTGTASGYNQTNYYSGGSSGAMGGYENLTDPVPAASMVYNHVGRALLGGFDGQPGSVPTVINGGDTASYTFSYTIPSTSNAADLHIIAVLLDATDGSLVSAHQTTVAEALSVQEVSGIDTIKLYPNPATDKLNIAFQDANGSYNVMVTDMLGRTVINNNYEGLFGSQNIELPVSQLNAGHYIMQITNGNAAYSSKFVVNK